MVNKKKMKAGIITIHFPYNYGAMLQAYATQKFLLQNNIDNEIIDFRPYEVDKDYHIRAEMIWKSPKMFSIMCISKLLGKRKKYNQFEKFMKRDLILSKKMYRKITGTKKLQYMNLIAGSDQIWNSDITHGRLEYMLDFDDAIRKMSYASSFGKDEIDKQHKEKIEERLRKFDNISVREEQGLKILQGIGIKDATKVCDPVFLLSKGEWSKFQSDEQTPNEKYLLLYSLQNNEEMNKTIKKVARHYNYKIVSVHPTGESKDFADVNIRNIGPREFISLIHNAQYIFSNSFHAIAFSIIFHKKFFAFLHSKTGSRVTNMLEQFCITTKEDQNVKMTFYTSSEKTHDAIAALVEKSTEYFLNALGVDAHGERK